MNTITGLPVAVESHCNARAGEGRTIGFGAYSRAFPSAQAWPPISLPLPHILQFYCLCFFPDPTLSPKPWVSPIF